MPYVGHLTFQIDTKPIKALQKRLSLKNIAHSIINYTNSSQISSLIHMAIKDHFDYKVTPYQKEGREGYLYSRTGGLLRDVQGNIQPASVVQSTKSSALIKLTYFSSTLDWAEVHEIGGEVPGVKSFQLWDPATNKYYGRSIRPRDQTVYIPTRHVFSRTRDDIRNRIEPHITSHIKKYVHTLATGK